MKFNLRNNFALAVLILCLMVIGFALPTRATAVKADSDYNYIDNGDFENPNYGYGGQNFGKWYSFGTQITSDGSLTHTGDYSIKVTETSQGSGVAYRLPSNSTFDSWIYGLEHTLSAWVNPQTATDITLKVDITVYTDPGHKNGFIVNETFSCEGVEWTKLNLPFKIEKTSGKLVITSGTQSVETVTGQLAAVDIFILAEESVSFNVDDVVLMPNIANVDEGKTVQPYNGNGKDVQGTGALADSGFELGVFATSFSETAWAPVGAFTKLTSVTDFTFAGNRAMMISGRTNSESSAHIRMSMAGFFADSKKYNFNAQVSSISPTEVLFKVRVYGFDGNAYPSAYIPISTALTENGKWSEMSGWLTVSYLSSDNKIEAKTDKGTFYIDNVIGVSALEFYFCTTQESKNSNTTLYVDNCYLSLLSKTVVPTDYEVERVGGTQEGGHPIFTTNTVKTEIKGISLKALGISVASAIVLYFVYSVVNRIYKKRMGESVDE